MFIDTSVIVALLSGDGEAARLADRIAAAKTRFTSGLVLAEAAVRLSVLLDVDPVRVESHLQTLLEEAQISVVPITSGTAKRAVAAFAAYGQGRAHAAQLTLTDCMAYACAEAYHVPLLTTCTGFAHTPLERADG